tara:strand:+ start:1138 stop:1470 length:333 start_codon:yes stop_codon:yes gene_type:complete
MSELFFTLKHDGGTHRVEIENQGDTCVIRFGASFTLRLDEENLNKLREHIHGAACDMQHQRPRSFQVGKDYLEEDLIHAGIDAEVNAETQNERSEQQNHDVWSPNDPVNW